MVVDCSAGCGRNAVLKVNEMRFLFHHTVKMRNDE
jgi:protein tyrosine phosphatase